MLLHEKVQAEKDKNSINNKQACSLIRYLRVSYASAVSTAHFAQHHHQFKIAFFLHFLTMISSDKLLTDKIQDHLSLKHRSATHNAHWLNQELTTRKLCIFIVSSWMEIYSIRSHSISSTTCLFIEIMFIITLMICFRIVYGNGSNETLVGTNSIFLSKTIDLRIQNKTLYF